MKCLTFIDSLPHKCIILKISDFSRSVTHYRQTLHLSTDNFENRQSDTLKFQKITLE